MRPPRREGGRPRGALGLPLGPAAGVAGVLALLLLVLLTRGGQVGEGADFTAIDRPLAELAPLPAGPAVAGADAARRRPQVAARAITADLDRRWRASTALVVADWAPLGRPLTPGLVADVATAPGPPGLALAHALARAAAGEVQARIGIRAAVDAAAADDPPAEAALRARLVRQAECLAGQYLASAHPPASLTPSALRRALAGRGADLAWLRRGMEAASPAGCAAFGDTG